MNLVKIHSNMKKTTNKEEGNVMSLLSVVAQYVAFSTYFSFPTTFKEDVYKNSNSSQD